MSAIARPLVAVLSFAVLFSGGAQSATVKGLNVDVDDIYSREILFHYLQNDYITVLSVPAAVQNGTATDRLLTNTDLLLAQAYLAYGLHNEVDEMFQRAADTNTSPQLLARTQLDLARVYYQRGNFQRAGEILARIDGNLPPEMTEELQVLLGDTFAAQGRTERAVEVWGSLAGASAWTYYGRYNRALALHRLNRTAEAVTMLEALGGVSSADEEVRGLRDKANLTLGQIFINEKAFDRAFPFLERVPAGSPYHEEALLNLGWGKALAHQYRASLAPWQKLHDGDVTNVRVQQALIGIPFALGQLGDQAASLKRNQDAISVFTVELDKIDTAIDSLRQGPLLDELLSLKPDAKSGGVKLSSGLLGTAGAGYLVELLTRNEFQAAFVNYRDLRVLRRSLSGWDRDIRAQMRVLQTRSKFAALTRQLEVARERIDQLLVEVDSLTEIHEDYIRDLAITTLNAEKERVKQYLGLVRLAAARIYDAEFVQEGGP